MIFCGHQQQQTLVQSHTTTVVPGSDHAPQGRYFPVHTQPKTSTFTHPVSANELSFTLNTVLHTDYGHLSTMEHLLDHIYHLSHHYKHSIPQNNSCMEICIVYIVKHPFLVDFQKKHKFQLNLQIQQFPPVQSWEMTHMQCSNKNSDNWNHLTQVTHLAILTFSQNFPYSPNTHFCYTRE